MSDEPRLSVPAPRLRPLRELTAAQLESAMRLADVLCAGPEHPVPLPSQCPEFAAKLDLALATRSDVFDLLLDLLDESGAAGDTADWLRGLHDERREAFEPLSSVLAGAYLMVPVIREHVNYPGQGRNPAPYDQIVEELSTGILDPVIERGPIHRAV